MYKIRKHFEKGQVIMGDYCRTGPDSSENFMNFELKMC